MKRLHPDDLEVGKIILTDGCFREQIVASDDGFPVPVKELVRDSSYAGNLWRITAIDFPYIVVVLLFKTSSGSVPCDGPYVYETKPQSLDVRKFVILDPSKEFLAQFSFPSYQDKQD